MTSKVMKSIQKRVNPNDKIYTPLKIVDMMLEFCDYKPGQSVLDPCRGLGAIYNKLAEPKFYCEIEENKDFFDWNKHVDIIIQNAPFSLITKFLIHTMKHCNKFCIIMGQYSLTPKRIEIMEEHNFFITKMLLTQIPTWFQRSYIIVAEKLDHKPKHIIFKSVNLGNRCLHCGCPCGGMKGQNIKHCKRKAHETSCRY